MDNDLDLKKLQEKIRLERERVAKLEKELEDQRTIVKGEDRQDQPLYESSSDAGIESGTEAEDCLSEK